MTYHYLTVTVETEQSHKHLHVQPFNGHIKPQSNRVVFFHKPTRAGGVPAEFRCIAEYLRYTTITVIGTLAVDGWAVTFGTAKSGLDSLRPCPGRSSLYQM